MNPIALRLLSQQLICPQFTRPEEVVAHFGAIQAQEYRMMRWAVAMRTKRPSEQAFAQAYDQGRIVRQHLLRGTWQLVSADDYWWMLDLFGNKAKATITGWMRSNKIDIAHDELSCIRDILIETTGKKRSATAEDYAQALAERGIVMDGHRLSYHIRFSELEGILCNGDLLPMKATYALSDEKIKRSPLPDRDESLMLLASKYFQSHQPATLEDFIWWSGLGINDCKRGIELLGKTIHLEKYKGREFYLMDNCRTRGFRKGEYLLIPPYDEYLIGYKSRDIVLDPELKHFAHNNSGIFQPVVAHGGVICGNWSPFKKVLDATFFDGEHRQESVMNAWDGYQKFKTNN